MLDLCCGDGYFCEQFLKDGGKSAVGVDNDPHFGMIDSLDKVNGNFDYGLFLDTHYHPGTEGFLNDISNRVSVLFTSCAYRPGKLGRSNISYMHELKKLWDSVKPIFQGPHNRVIFRCSK